MAFKDYFQFSKQQKKSSVQEPFLISKTNIPISTEAAKGLTTDAAKTVWDSKIGEKHPYNMNEMNSIYLGVPIVHGGVNKIVDFTVGPGFRVDVSDERANTILQVFMKGMDFDNLLRNVVRHLLVYGNAYWEVVTQNGTITALIQRSPETMFVRRNPTGEVEGYTQVTNKLMQKRIEFSPEEIIHFKLTSTNDSAYGTSIIWPIYQVVQRKLQLEKDMSKLTSRKAGAPLVVKVGSIDPPHFPTAADITTVKADVDALNNDTEWIVGPMFNFEVMNFKDKILDFQPFLEHYENQIVYGLEVPIVLLGRGNIPEGLAATQKEAFERKIVSIQQNVESIIESQVLSRILQVQGFTDLEVEFEWKEPDPAQQLEEVKVLTAIVQTGSFGAFSPAFLQQVEQRLADLLSFKEFNAPPKKELDRQQPQLPGSNQGKTQMHYHATERFDQALYDVPLKEFIGFNYQTYLQKIKEFVLSNDFIKREYQTFAFKAGSAQQDWEDVVVKYSLKDNLTKAQINKLRNTLLTGFDEGQSIRKIRAAILEKVKPSELLVHVPEVRDDEGEITRQAYSMTISAEQRAWSLARTETIRASNQGALLHYDGLGVKEVTWLATNDARVCPYCDDQNNAKLSLDEADERIPAHDGCRCTWLAVTE